MLIKNLILQNFRNYGQAEFNFSQNNIIIGKNTIGKTNILEAIYFLSGAKSFRAENEIDVIKTDANFSRISGNIEDQKETTKLLIILTKNNHFTKKYLINNVPKRQNDFVAKILTVLFTPADIEIITDSPSLRRKYFNNILSQVDKNYRLALAIYEKALKTRNRLLCNIKEKRSLPGQDEFSYWDNLLIVNGAIITKKREELISYINSFPKFIFDFSIEYDKSTISEARLQKYFEIEKKIGMTLVGPQRDDFIFNFPKRGQKIKEFGSRGQQRLTVLEMKLTEIEFLKEKTGQNPLLLLDDIFSELDNQNIKKILDLVNSCQTITTTTHKEFIPGQLSKKVNIINLE